MHVAISRGMVELLWNTMLKKIAFFELEAWEKDWVVKNLGGFSLAFFDRLLDEHHLPLERDFAALSVGEKSVVSKTVLDAFPRLELIAVRGRSTDHVDLAACREKHVMVCRVPHAATHAVAEFTLALILALSRKVCAALARLNFVKQNLGGLERGAKNDTSRDRLRGFDLYEKTLGVIGTGNIGKAVIAIAKGFGMKVLAWNPKQNLELAASLGFAYVPLENLLAHADIITIHAPYIEPHMPASTHHLLNAELLRHVKRGAVLVNTSHLEIVDAGALAEALRNGRIGGVALDAAGANITDEFARDERVLLTPRVGGYTQDALEDVLKVTAENIQAYFRGFPQHCVGEVVFPQRRYI